MTIPRHNHDSDTLYKNVQRHQHIASAHADNSSGTPSHAPPSAYSAHSHDAQHTPGGASDAFHSRRWGPGKLIDPTNLDDLLRFSTGYFCIRFAGFCWLAEWLC